MKKSVLSFMPQIIFTIALSLSIIYAEDAIYLMILAGYMMTTISTYVHFKFRPYSSLGFVALLFLPSICAYVLEGIYSPTVMVTHLISSFLFLFYSIPFLMISIIALIVTKFSKKDDENVEEENV